MRSFALLLPLAVFGCPSCFVPARDPRPNTDSPPRILDAEVAGSITTPSDAVFLVTQVQGQPPNGKTSVRLDLDIVDDDSNPVFARAYIVGPAPTSVFDASVAGDGAVASNFVRRFFDETVVVLVDGRGTGDFTIPNDQFTDTGRCYTVEVRVSSHFQVAANVVADPDLRHLPERTEDLALRRYWVASYGPSTTSVDLSTCPVQP